MSNSSSCISILTHLIGFEKGDNDEKVALPDGVEINTLVEFKNFLQVGSIIESNLNDELSSYEMKMVDNNETFWSCIHCTYNNPIELNTCEICRLPRNVCGKSLSIFHHSPKKYWALCFVCIIFVKNKKIRRIILCKRTMMKTEKFVCKQVK